MNHETLRAIPTCEVPAPILEEPFAAAAEKLPRILVQEGGSRVHEKRLLALAALFLTMVLLQATLLVKLPGGKALVIYQETPRLTLLEAAQ